MTELLVNNLPSLLFPTAAIFLAMLSELTGGTQWTHDD